MATVHIARPSANSRVPATSSGAEQVSSQASDRRSWNQPMTSRSSSTPGDQRANTSS
jgi:hypothetical protein